MTRQARKYARKRKQAASKADKALHERQRIRLDESELPELRERSSKMKQISPSENQIAKRLNETGNIAAKNPSAFWLSNMKIAEVIGVIPVDVLPKAEQA